MTESRSLMVRSGMMTSFCAATVVTPFFVTVFMMGKKEWGRERERNGLFDGSGHPLVVSDRETKKNGAMAPELRCYGVSI